MIEVILTAIPSFAEEPEVSKILFGEGNVSLKTAVVFALNVFFLINLLLTLVFLLWGGLLYLTSGGDGNAIGKAQKALTGCIIGIVLTFLAYTLIELITSSIGVEMPI